MGERDVEQLNWNILFQFEWIRNIFLSPLPHLHNTELGGGGIRELSFWMHFN